jgi:hypothetical protein
VDSVRGMLSLRFAALELWSSRVQKLLGIHTTENLDQLRDEASPSSLMAGSQASAVITMEVLAEQLSDSYSFAIP